MVYIYIWGLKSSQEEFPSSQVPKATHGWCQHFRGQGKSKIDLVLSENKAPPNRIVIIFSLNNFHLGVYTSSSAKPRYYISNQNTNEHSTNIEDRPHVSRMPLDVHRCWPCTSPRSGGKTFCCGHRWVQKEPGFYVFFCDRKTCSFYPKYSVSVLI